MAQIKLCELKPQANEGNKRAKLSPDCTEIDIKRMEASDIIPGMTKMMQIIICKTTITRH